MGTVIKSTAIDIACAGRRYNGIFCVISEDYNIIFFQCVTPVCYSRTFTRHNVLARISDNIEPPIQNMIAWLKS